MSEGIGWLRKQIVKHPWILTIYLLVVSLSAFILPASIKPYCVASLILLQLLLLAGFGLFNWDILRALSRLKFLFLFLIGVNAFLHGNGDSDLHWSIPGIEISLNITGLLSGVLMSSQIALVVLTTHVVRNIGDEKAFINGLRSLKVAPLLAYSIDTTLAVLGGTLKGGNGGQGGGKGRGGGRGDGTGGGRSQNREASGKEGRKSADNDDGGVSKTEPKSPQGILPFFNALRKRDLTPVIENLENGLEQARNHTRQLGLNEKTAHDVAIISGIASVMMAFKLIKVMPGLPVMQGAKTIFFIPMYVLAADRTHSRWGGTIAGGIIGFIGFLNGDGRYGIFEILKHLIPGLVIDLIWPFVKLFRLQFWILVLVGLLAALARTSTQFAIILALGSDKASLLVFPALKLIPNSIAGAMSALVTYPVLKKLSSKAIDDRSCDETENVETPSVENETKSATVCIEKKK